MKIPYVLVVGEKRRKDDAVAVRERKGDEGAVKLAEWLEKIKKEIAARSLLKIAQDRRRRWSTASGKTALAIAIARRFDGEIVSADSRQIYRGMDIGNRKTHKAEMRRASSSY